MTVEEPYLAAHAAGQEVYPAVFILEAVRQAVALALGERDGLLADLAAIRSLRVIGALHPADQLIVEATVDPRGPDGVIAVEARCRPLDGPPMGRLVLEFWPGPAAGGPAADGHAPDTGQSPGTAPPPGIGRLLAMLPAGPTIVLVDRIVGMVPGQSLSAVKAVTFSEPCYQDLASGLPDERYAYPASLMIESFGQAAIVLWHSRPDSVLADKARLPVLAALRDCRLEGRVYPGDTLRREVEFVRSVEATAFVTGATWAGTRRVATMGSVIITATMPL